MRWIAVAIVLLGLSGAVEYFSQTYVVLWALGIAPIHFINGCRLVALALVIVAVVKAYRLKVPA
ncbi:hypothetical protein LMG23992_04878 [Cupriavidus laharis]|uniref:Uncharacterized protein n=1 Tax=Cupriavidus laharis TaxID=151654 RepID=A0ABN7ZAK4_9BURK|nr:hypothetical protein [Cupriavidus laharis]CAG9182994.1 hypothetical protein LMG23992_04878 [Cupriavidus laharis]